MVKMHPSHDCHVMTSLVDDGWTMLLILNSKPVNLDVWLKVRDLSFDQDPISCRVTKILDIDLLIKTLEYWWLNTRERMFTKVSQAFPSIHNEIQHFLQPISDRKLD